MTDSNDERLDAEWVEPVSKAVHDQRGVLSNVVVLSSLLRRKIPDTDERMAGLLDRLDRSAETLGDICGDLQLFADSYAAEVSATEVRAEDLFEGDVDVGGGLEEVRVIVPQGLEELLVPSVIDAARAVSGDDAVAAAATAVDAEVHLSVAVRCPTALEPEALWDGTWSHVAVGSPRGLPLRMLVIRRSMEHVGGGFDASREGDRLTLVLRLPVA